MNLNYHRAFAATRPGPASSRAVVARSFCVLLSLLPAATGAKKDSPAPQCRENNIVGEENQINHLAKEFFIDNKSAKEMIREHGFEKVLRAAEMGLIPVAFNGFGDSDAMAVLDMYGPQITRLAMRHFSKTSDDSARSYVFWLEKYCELVKKTLETEKTPAIIQLDLDKARSWGILDPEDGYYVVRSLRELGVYTDLMKTYVQNNIHKDNPGEDAYRYFSSKKEWLAKFNEFVRSHEDGMGTAMQLVEGLRHVEIEDIYWIIKARLELNVPDAKIKQYLKKSKNKQNAGEELYNHFAATK